MLVTAVTRDNPEAVADIASYVTAQGFNIAAGTSLRLGRAFRTTTFVIEGSDLTADEVEAGLRDQLATSKPAVIHVDQVQIADGDFDASTDAGGEFEPVQGHGPDRRGVVAALATALLTHSATVRSMTVKTDHDRHEFHFLFKVEVLPSDRPALESTLGQLRTDLELAELRLGNAPVRAPRRRA